jgi:hypothetical protein
VLRHGSTNNKLLSKKQKTKTPNNQKIQLEGIATLVFNFFENQWHTASSIDRSNYEALVETLKKITMHIPHGSARVLQQLSNNFICAQKPQKL